MNAPPLALGFAEIPFLSVTAVIADQALTGRLREVRGVLNASSPLRLSVHDYYAGAAAHAGVTVTIVGDGTRKPARAIDAARLWALLPEHTWLGPWARTQ